MKHARKTADELKAVREFARRCELEHGGCDDPIMDEEDAQREAMRAAGFRVMQRFYTGLRLLAQYEGNKLMALDCFILALGKGEFIGAQTSVQLAERHFADPDRKWTVNKCVDLFRQVMGLEGMAGQRSSTARKRMGAARNGQLKRRGSDALPK
jgi:hypothetical protein